MVAEASQFKALHPGRCVHFSWGFSPSTSKKTKKRKNKMKPKQIQMQKQESEQESTITLSVSLLDCPSHFDAARPFAAILVPHLRESDWIFSTDNGLWELLFSASASRLVVLRRSSTASMGVREGEETLGTKRKRHPSTSSKEGGEDDLRPGISYEDDNLICHSSGPSRGLREGEEILSMLSGSFLHPLTGLQEGGEDDICPDIFDEDDDLVKQGVSPLLETLFPRCLCSSGPMGDPFVLYDDLVRTRLLVQCVYSPLCGNIIVEDVELSSETEDASISQRQIREHDFNLHGGMSCSRKLRRRMRFQQTPNLIQTEVSITVLWKNGQPASNVGLKEIMTGTDFIVRPDHSKLVHKYLPPIVAGFVLVSPVLEACMQAGKKVKVLSIGIGGGALPIFLHQNLGFHVIAVDLDNVVLELAGNHFGLKEEKGLDIKLSDGVDIVFNIAYQAIQNNLVPVEQQSDWDKLSIGGSCALSHEQNNNADPRVNVIVVDVNVGDPCLGLISPPRPFLQKTFLHAARIALLDGGMLAMNIIPRGTKDFQGALKALRDVFEGLYEIQEEENHVVFAFPTKIREEINMHCNLVLNLMQIVDEDLFYRIQEV